MSAPESTILPSRGTSNYVLFVMFTLTALNVMDRQVLSVLVEPVKLEFGLSDAEMGLLTGSAFALAHVLAMIPIARLADVGSRRNVIAVGIFLWSTLTALTGLAAAYWHLFLTRVGVGACETVGSGPSQSLLADYFAPERRGTALSIHAAGGTVGAMAGFAIGGLLADAIGWRWTFVCFGVPGILLAFVIFATVKEPGRGVVDGFAASEMEDEAPSFPEVIRYLIRLRSFRHVVLAGSFNSFANWSMLSWSAAAMMRGHDLSATEVGARLAVSVTLFSTLGIVAAGFLADRLGRRDDRWYLWLPALASLAAFPFLAAFLLVPDPDLAFWIVIPGAFLNTMWIGTNNAVVQMLARPRMRATAASIFSMITAGLVGQGFGPVFVGVLSDHWAERFGPDAPRYAIAVAVAASLWAFVHNLLAARTLHAERPGPAATTIS